MAKHKEYKKYHILRSTDSAKEVSIIDIIELNLSPVEKVYYPRPPTKVYYYDRE